MEVRFNAPLATQAQCTEGAQAARAVFEASGLSPLAARNAFTQVQGNDEAEQPSPATVRAARTWSRACDAAVRACFGASPRPPQADLDVA
ncbi:hypothetical protein [Pseudorhodoferax sp. Leaf274]|uniref:hypothetical protein n=1 Tax=Pseudorhodoferax sp. Leaf274 TaxID=1736318 RepID=UPI0007025AC5|nr:hypothetical protein [Pseudorhodoferax sp. Leaf274]KQP35489.1 hypothetical protein ASF44_19330 [Pseudorhodoferax sp. Leaf274]